MRATEVTTSSETLPEPPADTSAAPEVKRCQAAIRLGWSDWQRLYFGFLCCGSAVTRSCCQALSGPGVNSSGICFIESAFFPSAEIKLRERELEHEGLKWLTCPSGNEGEAAPLERDALELPACEQCKNLSLLLLQLLL